MKRLSHALWLICFMSVAFSFAMEEEEKKPSKDLFEKYDANILLPPLDNGPSIKKAVFVAAPEDLEKAKDEQYQTEVAKNLDTALKSFIHHMHANDRGWHYPKNAPGFQYIHPELFTMVKMPETYFMFHLPTKRLLLRWDLGEHNGWGYDQVFSIDYDSEHQKMGTCSELTIQYHQEKKGVHGKVSLAQLRESYKTSGKTCILNPSSRVIYDIVCSQEERDAVHIKDIVAMAQYYLVGKKIKNLAK